MKISHTSQRLCRSLPLCLALSGSAARAETLFSESFDSDQAKVKMVSGANTAISYVDYSDFTRSVPAAGGSTLRLHIPEAPNRIPGSAATKGVTLSCLYNGTARSILLLAAEAAAGSPRSFTGRYRVTFDMWLSLDPTALASSAGTTEGGIWAVNTTGTVALGHVPRASGQGNWGWITTEGGAGATAGAGDVTIYNDGTQLALAENLGQASLFAQAFPQGSPLLNTPNNQWTAVEMEVTGSRVRLKLNGVVFHDQTSTLTAGSAGFGYDDFSTGSASFSPNWQFGLFDNFVVESIPDIPVLEVTPQTVFPTVVDNLPVSGDFLATNTGATDLSILSAAVDGPDAAQFSLAAGQTFPMIIAGQESGTVALNFNSSTPNGLKTARLILTTNDPNAPTITLPLQARRKITTVEATVVMVVGSVSATGDSSMGKITVTNSSAGPVNLTGATTSGANPGDFSVVTPFPITLQSGETADLDVKFAPTGAMGVHAASIDIATSDPNVPTLSVQMRARFAFGPPLLAQYKMDETAGTSLVDASGTSPKAALEIRDLPFGYAVPSLLPNGEGTACRFTPAETNTTGNFAHALVPHLPNVSYSLWIKPEAKTGSTTRTILHRSSLFTTLGTLYSLNLSPTGQLLFDINKLNSGGASTVQTEDGAIVDGRTYHVVVTHTDENGFSDGNEPIGTRTRLFINGSMVSEAFPDSPGYTDYLLTSTSEGLYIASATSSGAGYQGDLDDLQIYSVELTPEQVAGMYQQPGKTAFNLETVTVPFDITSLVYNATAGTITISWSSQTGAVYQVLQSSTLSGFTPVPNLTNIPSAGATTSAVITGVTPGGKNFYRIGRVSP